jgi:hypothetical protein
MELIYLSQRNDTKKIPFELTYGLHKELQDYLLNEDRLFKLFTDVTVSDTVLKICLSTRNNKGQVVGEFTDFETLDTEEVLIMLEELYDHFSNFF